MITWLDFALVAFAALALHRLWLKESIFIRPREWLVAKLTRLSMPGFAKALSCPPCFAFWCSVTATAAWSWHPSTVVIPAVYTLVRWGMEGWYLLEKQSQFAAYQVQPVNPPQAVPPSTGYAVPPQMTMGGSPANTVSNAALSVPGACGACKAAQPTPPKPKIVLMTTFMSFDRAYSLAGVVIDQARALAMKGVPVEVWCSEGVSMAQWPKDMPSNVAVLGRVPNVAWKEDELEPAIVDRVVAFLKQSHDMLKGATVITHDLQFVAHYAAFAKALRDVGPLEGVTWFHECHSRPSAVKSSAPNAGWRQSLMEGHSAIVPTHSDRIAMAGYFGVAFERVVAVPHVRDLRSLNRWVDESRSIVAKRPDLLTADIVQVYPFSTPRGTAKGVELLINVFASLKKRDHHAILVLVNAHAAGEESRVQSWRSLATASGLGEGLIITSELGFVQGISGDAVADLQQIANAFVFPSISESFGLVLIEAALNKQVVVIPTAGGPILDVVDPASASLVDFHTGEQAVVDVANVLESRLREKAFLAHRDSLRRFSLETVGQQLIDAVGWKADT